MMNPEPIEDLVTGWLDGASDLASMASAYAKRWAVFPLAPRSKLPLIGKRFGGKGVLDATRNLEQVRKWWEINANANIGIATGEPSGFFVVDVDLRKGGDETLAELEQRHGPLPETVISHTGGGGQHLLFRHVVGIRNSAERRLGPGIDIRGDGGYVCAPPSVHENGRLYVWNIDHHPDDMPIAEAPTWLIELARTPAAGKAAAELPENWRRLVANGVAEGRRNEAVARLSGHLLRKRVDPLVVLELARVWNSQRCRPPLDDAEVIRTVDSIAAAELRRRGAA
jgi:hypothetical protein